MPPGASSVPPGEIEKSNTVTSALAVAVGLVTLAATVWPPTCDGAVYSPCALIVPTAEFPPLTPSTDQVTVGLPCPCTVAWNCCVAPVVTPAVAGVIDNVVTAAVTVTVALALSAVSATLVAVTVCVPAWDGAVYIPALVIVPAVALPPAVESTDHVTAVFVVPWTAAVNCCCVPGARLTEATFN